MKRLQIGLATAVVVGSMIAAVPAQAAPPQKSAESIQITGADAFFSTAPQDGSFEPGVTYRDVGIHPALEATPQNGNVLTPVANIDINYYTLDAQGGYHVSSYLVLHGEGSDVTFTYDSKLTSASLNATVAGKICTVDANDPNLSTCEPYGGGVVTATWTSTSGLMRLSDNNRSLLPGQTIYVSHERQTGRNASAEATLFGSSLDGFTYGAIYTDTKTARLTTR